jgi:hypothetical protein
MEMSGISLPLVTAYVCVTPNRLATARFRVIEAVHFDEAYASTNL